MKQLFSIIIALGISFAVVKVTAPFVFVENTPQVSSEFIAAVTNLPRTSSSLIASLFAPKKQTETPDAKNVFVDLPKIQVPANLVFAPVAKGVKAAEDTATGKKYVHIDKDTAYHTEQIEINGKMVTVIRFDK
jgi:hypothetical protein